MDNKTLEQLSVAIKIVPRLTQDQYDGIVYVLKAYYGHAGRPGLVGGSMPRHGGTGVGVVLSSVRANNSSYQQHTNPDGSWTAERQALHKKIIDKYFEGKTPVESPMSFMLGGGSAAGKTTLVNSGLVDFPKNTVLAAADEIKSYLPEYKEKGAFFVHDESAYISKQIVMRAAKQGYNVLLDWTGGNSLETRVEIMRAMGQPVKGTFVTVDIPTALKRSHQRAKDTGRDVPDNVLISIHKKISRDFPGIAENDLFDTLDLFDTGTPTPTLVAKKNKGEPLIIIDQKKYKKFLEKARFE